MSYLYRTGNGRNNIAFTTTANSSTKYLRRTSTGRNNIVWTTIPEGSTYNILQRNGTGRNNILWANLNIYNPGLPVSSTDITSGIDSAGAEPDAHIVLNQILPSLTYNFYIVSLHLYHNIYEDDYWYKAEWTCSDYNYNYNGANVSHVNNSLVFDYFGYNGIGLELWNAYANFSGFSRANKLTVIFPNSQWMTFHLINYKFKKPNPNNTDPTGYYTFEYTEYKTNVNYDFENATDVYTVRDDFRKICTSGTKVVFSTKW